MLRHLCPALLLLMTACGGDFPRDTDGTLDRIRADKQFHVALALAPDGRSDPRIDALLQRVADAAGAAPRLESGDAEPSLTRLEDGEIDLVIGRFDKSTPWSTLVTLGPPLRRDRRGRTELQLAPVMKNGENAWIALVEKAARDVAPESQ